MSFDYKKEYKEYYMPKNKPEIVDVPEMKFIALRGKGNPNEEGGEYKAAIGLLYGIAFTIKMSKKGNHQIEGYFDYVVPPLEGFWWQDGVAGIDYAQVTGLRLEARQKLDAIRPKNLGQAGRVSGVSPADTAALMIYLEGAARKKDSGTPP